MTPLLVIWADLRALVVETAQVWWRLLPQLLALWLGGWIGYQATLWIAVAVSLHNGWIAVGIFAVGFVFTLGAIVAMLRLIGRELGIRHLVGQRPRDNEEGDDGGQDDGGRDDGGQDDDGIARLLATTLLPFLGIYAAFNYVSQMAENLNVRALVVSGLLSDHTLLKQLDPTTSGTKLIIVACVVVGAYIVRRSLDLLHERTGWRWLGIVVAAIEAFFILTVLLSGQKILQKFSLWLFDRQVFAWISGFGRDLAAFFAVFAINLPAVVTTVAGFVAGTVWPGFLNVLVEPVAWLAVAALVYGSHVLSLADLWRKGRPLSSEVPIPRRLRRVRERKVGSTGWRRVTIEFQEAFLGDVDDKYLPTLQSIRLILRSGLTFLGAYVLAYSMIRALETLIATGATWLTHGRPMVFWVTRDPFFDLVEKGLTEPLRIVLLAVAFHRCLLLFKAKAADVTAGELPADVVRRARALPGPAPAAVPVGAGSARLIDTPVRAEPDGAEQP